MTAKTFDHDRALAHNRQLRPVSDLDAIEHALEEIHNRWPQADLILMAATGGTRMTCRGYGHRQRLLAMLEQGSLAMAEQLPDAPPDTADKDAH